MVRQNGADDCGFIMMNMANAGRIVQGVVWVCHLAYFLLVIKTIMREEVTA